MLTIHFYIAQNAKGYQSESVHLCQDIKFIETLVKIGLYVMPLTFTVRTWHYWSLLCLSSTRQPWELLGKLKEDNSSVMAELRHELPTAASSGFCLKENPFAGQMPPTLSCLSLWMSQLQPWFAILLLPNTLTLTEIFGKKPPPPSQLHP